MASTREKKRLGALFRKLNVCPFTPFNQKNRSLKAKQGVYVIYGKRKKVLHVGRTTRAANGLFQRLNNHLRGQSSFYKKYARKKGININKCYFKYVVINNPRRRAIMEAYVTGKLIPSHIGTGE